MKKNKYRVQSILVDTKYNNEIFTYSIKFSSGVNSFYTIISADEMRRNNIQKGAEPILIKLSGFTYAPELNNRMLKFGEVNEYPIKLTSQKLEIVNGKSIIKYKEENLEALISIEDELPEDLDFSKQYLMLLYNHRLSLEQYEI